MIHHVARAPHALHFTFTAHAHSQTSPTRHCAFSHLVRPRALPVDGDSHSSVAIQRGTCRTFDDVPRTQRYVPTSPLLSFLPPRTPPHFLSVHTRHLSRVSSHRGAPTRYSASLPTLQHTTQPRAPSFTKSTRRPGRSRTNTPPPPLEHCRSAVYSPPSSIVQRPHALVCASPADHRRPRPRRE